MSVPITKTIFSMPVLAISRTANSITGVLIIGRSTLGTVRVTGKKRVPRPATGTTAYFNLHVYPKPQIRSRILLPC